MECARKHCPRRMTLHPSSPYWARSPFCWGCLLRSATPWTRVVSSLYMTSFGFRRARRYRCARASPGTLSGRSHPASASHRDRQWTLPSLWYWKCESWNDDLIKSSPKRTKRKPQQNLRFGILPPNVRRMPPEHLEPLAHRNVVQCKFRGDDAKGQAHKSEQQQAANGTCNLIETWRHFLDRSKSTGSVLPTFAESIRNVEMTFRGSQKQHKLNLHKSHAVKRFSSDVSPRPRFVSCDKSKCGTCC